MKQACIAEAVGVLMECFGVEAAEAESILRSWSAHHDTSVTTIAHVLVHQIWLGDEHPEDRTLTRAVEECLRRLPGRATQPLSR
jgi:hypothetical protein